MTRSSRWAFLISSNSAIALLLGPSKKFIILLFLLSSGDHLDLKKSFEAAILPTAALVGIGILSIILNMIPLGDLICVLSTALFVASLAAYGWAGYRSVKEYKLDLVGGVLAGAIAGALGGIINGILAFILMMIGIGAAVAEAGEAGASMMAFSGAVGIFAIAVGVVIGVILGAVLGAIGAFVAQKK